MGSMDSSVIPEGTVICLLCRGTVTYVDNDNTLFFKHLKMEHSVHYDHKFVLAVNFFDEDSKQMVIENFEVTTERKRKENSVNENNDTVEDDIEEMEELEFMAKVDKQINEITSHKNKQSDVEKMIDVDDLSLDESMDDNKDPFRETVSLEANKVMDKKFKCETCGESFQLFNMLKQHKLKHVSNSGNTKSTKSCDICSAVMSNSGNLSRHYKRIHPGVDRKASKINPNYNGEEISATKAPIMEHLNNTREPVIQQQKENGNHLKDGNSENLSTVCFQCKTDLLNSKRLKRHRSNTKHQIYPPQDQEMSQLQVKTENLEATKINATPASNEFSNFGQHFLASNNDAQSDVNECKLCSKTFMTKKLLSRHNSKHHTVKPFSCEDCPKTFVDWLNLRRHMFQYHPQSLQKPGLEKEEEVKKERNDEMNKNGRDINEVINDVKRELTNGNDDDSGKNSMEDKSSKASFSFQSILANAIGNDSKEDSLTCNVCDKEFDSHHTLKRHKITHSGAKPFSCDKCDNSFNQKANLKRHMNRAHR